MDLNLVVITGQVGPIRTKTFNYRMGCVVRQTSQDVVTVVVDSIGYHLRIDGDTELGNVKPGDRVAVSAVLSWGFALEGLDGIAERGMILVAKSFAVLGG